jgi:hypothetical protein
MEECENSVKPQIITLRGHINTTRKGILYITLRNAIGQESFAECEKSILRAYNIAKGFEIDISVQNEQGFDSIKVVLRTPKMETVLQESELLWMSETIEQVFSDNKIKVKNGKHNKKQIRIAKTMDPACTR